MKRPPCCDKSNVKRGLWTVEEDAKMLAYIYAHGTGNWPVVPRKAGLNRCGKSCRLRWTNYLRPSAEEEQLIISLHKAIGSRWSLIAQQLPGRTDNDVKNYWNIKLKKKLSKMGIDPLTHKPLSQIISEIGNIKGSSHFIMVQALAPPEISCITGNSGLEAEHVPRDFSPLRSYPLCSPLSLLTGFPSFDSSPDLLPFGQSPFSLSSQQPVISGDMFMKDNGRFPRIPSSLSALPIITLDSILCQGNEAKLAFESRFDIQ